MALPKTVALIADRLNSTGAIWMAAGSIAAMTYGDYRVTSGIDIILVLAPSNVGKVGAAFPLEEFYCPPLDVISTEAARPERGHFNLIHHDTGFKADIYVAGTDALTRWALAHRQKFPSMNPFCGSPRPSTSSSANWNSSAKVAARNTCETFAACLRKRKSIGASWEAKSQPGDYRKPGRPWKRWTDLSPVTAPLSAGRAGGS